MASPAADGPCGLAGLAEVEAPQQLAHDQNIGSSNHLGAQRGRVFERRKAHGRPQVGENPEFVPQPQEPPFGAEVARKTVEQRSADGSEQNRLRSQAGIETVNRQRVFGAEQGGAANVLAGRLQLMAKTLGHGFEHSYRFVGNLRPNAVARENGEFEDHLGMPTMARKQPLDHRGWGRFQRIKPGTRPLNSPQVVVLLVVMFRHRIEG